MNPVATVIAKVQQLTDHFQRKQMDVPPVEPVVYFSDPGAHIETTRPGCSCGAWRRVQRFITAVLTSPIVLDGDVTQVILDDLTGLASRQGLEQDIRDMYSLQEPPPPKKPENLPVWKK